MYDALTLVRRKKITKRINQVTQSNHLYHLKIIQEKTD